MMKKLNVITVIVLFLSFVTLNAQNDRDTKSDNHGHNYQDHGSSSKFSFVMYGGVGYAVVDNDNQPNYNLNASTADFLINYRIGKRYGIATGVGVNRLSGTGFNAGGNFYHERGTLKIPLLLTVDYNLSHKVRLVANIGLYAQTITKDEYSFVGGTIDDIYEGWNFGLQSGVGLAYNFNHKTSLGIMFNTQGDFNRLDSDPNKSAADEQKVTGINTVGLLFAIHF